MNLTIGKLAEKYGLSRSTLLYYDSIGLLCPSGHVKGEYRLYGKEQQEQLKSICRYRQAGIPLKKIKKILDSPETSLGSILRQRFDELGKEILLLHEQQQVIAGLLQSGELLSQSRGMTKDLWVSLLRSSGFTEADMRRWHIQFEKMDPAKHLAFLQHLKIPDEEIEQIRNMAQGRKK